jgi:hypothetical protein
LVTLCHFFSGFLSFGHSLLPQAVLPAAQVDEERFDMLPNPFFIHQFIA